MVGVLFVLLPLLLAGPQRLRHAVAVRLVRFGVWVLPHLQRDDAEVDPVAAAQADAARRERLAFDLQRLRHLLRTDQAMSATRQLANRIAYDWVCRDVAALSGGLPTTVGALPPAAPTTTREILDLRWR